MEAQEQSSQWDMEPQMVMSVNVAGRAQDDGGPKAEFDQQGAALQLGPSCGPNTVSVSVELATVLKADTGS